MSVTVEVLVPRLRPSDINTKTEGPRPVVASLGPSAHWCNASMNRVRFAPGGWRSPLTFNPINLRAIRKNPTRSFSVIADPEIVGQTDIYVRRSKTQFVWPPPKQMLPNRPILLKILLLSILSMSFSGVTLMEYRKKGGEELGLQKNDALRCSRGTITGLMRVEESHQSAYDTKSSTFHRPSRGYRRSRLGSRASFSLTVCCDVSSPLLSVMVRRRSA